MTLDSIYEKYHAIRDRVLPPIFATLLGVFFILLCDRREPLIVDALTITPNPVHSGTKAYVIFGAQSKRDCDGEVRRTIVDSGGHVFVLSPEPSIYPSLLPDDKRQFVKTFDVPFGMKPGVATYIADVYRWCNPPQHLFWNFHNHYETTFVVH